MNAQFLRGQGDNTGTASRRPAGGFNGTQHPTSVLVKRCALQEKSDEKPSRIDQLTFEGKPL